MARKTQHDKLVEALKALGCQDVPNARTEKYTVLTYTGTAKATDGKPLFWYVGEKGALRRGATASRSIPVNEPYRKKLLGE